MAFQIGLHELLPNYLFKRFLLVTQIYHLFYSQAFSRKRYPEIIDFIHAGF